MIKLTRLSFDLKKDVKRKTDDILSVHEEAVNHARMMNNPVPTKPVIEYKPKDFDEMEHSYGILLQNISDVSVSVDGYTAIEKTNGDVIAVKEDINDVFAMIDAEELRLISLHK